MLIVATNYLIPYRGITIQLVSGNNVIHGITMGNVTTCSRECIVVKPKR